MHANRHISRQYPQKNSDRNINSFIVFRQVEVGQYSPVDVLTSPTKTALPPVLSVAFPCYSLWLAPVALWHTPLNFSEFRQHGPLPIDGLNTSVQCWAILSINQATIEQKTRPSKVNLLRQIFHMWLSRCQSLFKTVKCLIIMFSG